MLKKIDTVYERVKHKYFNKLLYRNKKISKIEYDMRNAFLKHTHQFGVYDFYQSYPPLKISGIRNTLSRFKVYKLKDKLNSHDRVLDIGGNIGFLSSYISRYVKEVVIVEKNKHLTDICNMLLKHEKIENVKTINQDFKEYKNGAKYDMIFSLAMHYWVGMTLEDYLKKITKFMHGNSLILFESHIIYEYAGDKDIEDQLKQIPFIEIIEQDEIDDHNGNIRKFFYLRKK